jgi:alkylhydroperoxidase family enzyme
MRLSSIDRPNSILLKLFYFLSKKYFGKVIAPLRVVYARSKPAMMTSLKILSMERKLVLPEDTRLLIRYFTSHFNDCKFCSNINEFGAAKASIELQKLKQLMNYKNSLSFTPKEKNLLAYLEEINTIKTVTDDVFNELQAHYSDKEIVEITWLNATENYFNLMAKPLGLESDDLKYFKKKDRDRAADYSFQ